MDSFGELFASQGEYHYNKINILIHVICVPQIVFSLFGLLYNVDDFIPFVGLTGLLLFILSAFYLKTEFTCGGVTAAWLWVMYFIIKMLHYFNDKQYLPFNLNTFLFVQHVFSWVAQFIGHGVFEHRSPALMDNVLLVFNAPFFVTAEILRHFGWKAKEFELIDKEIESRVQVFRSKKL